MDEEVVGKLENWFVYVNNKIVGDVYNDSKERFKNGTQIRTSISKIDISKLKEGSILETRNSKYLLGKPLKENK